MTRGPVSERASRLAAVAGRLGEADWRADAERLAGASAGPPDDGPIPTYGEVARLGTGVVVALAAQERWDEAVVQARHLMAFFARTGLVLGPIAVEAFDGLLAACLARDPDEVRDFAELVEELFP
jgi:hypothetical protein